MKSIKLRREACGMKQVDMAERFGVSQGTIVNWEREDGLPPCRVLPELAALFGCTIDELFDSRKETNHE